MIVHGASHQGHHDLATGSRQGFPGNSSVQTNARVRNADMKATEILRRKVMRHDNGPSARRQLLASSLSAGSGRTGTHSNANHSPHPPSPPHPPVPNPPPPNGRRACWL
ncbi:hypothetical protein RRF57_006958 [Xylaria bambusicola]|uniref:Uncharacterized protein n=1 Tax=Xylaria bambusicola TaxID=326684 RepID=A0AAN7UUE1_9PEZI